MTGYLEVQGKTYKIKNISEVYDILVKARVGTRLSIKSIGDLVVVYSVHAYQVITLCCDRI